MDYGTFYSIPCDGHIAAALTFLSQCKVQHIRTLCQPADGLATVGGQIVAFVYDNVPQNCSRGWLALIPHELDLELLGATSPWPRARRFWGASSPARDVVAWGHVRISITYSISV